MEGLADKISKIAINIDSGTAEKIAQQYIEFLRWEIQFNWIMAVVICVVVAVLVVGSIWFINKILPW